MPIRPRQAHTDVRRRARGHRTGAVSSPSGATVFAEKGFHAARVDDIVRAARSSHGTFYLYFVSKEDLFDQLIDEVTQDIAALVDDLPKVTNSEKGRAALRDWLDQFADLYERSGAVIRTWTEAELSGEGVGRKGADAIGEPGRNAHDPYQGSQAIWARSGVGGARADDDV